MADDQTFDERAGSMFDQPQDSTSVPAWMNGATAQPPTPPQQNGSASGGLMSDPTLQALEGAGSSLMVERKAALDPRIAAISRDLQRPGPAPPKLEQAPKAPQQQIGQGALEFMQIATVFGALAGLFARRGTTTALNAFAGAIQGFSQGNLEVFKAKSAEWKQSVEDVKQNNQAKLDQYETIWKDRKLNIDQKLEEMKVVASQYGDEITYNLAEQRNYTMLAQANQKERQFQMEFDRKSKATEAQVDKIHKQIEQMQVLSDPGSKPNIIAKAMEEGSQPPVTTGLYGQAANVKAALARDGFDLSKAQLEWDAAKKQVQSLNGPQMTRYAGLANSVIKTIDEVKDLSEQMKNSGVPLANRAKLAALIQTRGNTPQGQLAARYIASVNTLKEEFANLAQGGYAPTEPVWALANQQVNADYGVQELGASLTEIQRLLRYRLQGIPNFETLGPAGTNRYTGSKGGSGLNEQTAPAGPAPGQGGWGAPQVVQ